MIYRVLPHVSFIAIKLTILSSDWCSGESSPCNGQRCGECRHILVYFTQNSQKLARHTFLILEKDGTMLQYLKKVMTHGLFIASMF